MREPLRITVPDGRLDSERAAAAKPVARDIVHVASAPARPGARREAAPVGSA